MAKNIEMNWFNGSGYEALYPNSISNLIQLSETLLDCLGLDNGTIDDIISNPSIFVQAITGCVFWYASKTIPEGFLLCDGSLISRTNYAGLFAIIGTTFGAGDGSTTFGIPDLRAKFVRGAGLSAGYGASFGNTEDATSLTYVRKNSTDYSLSTDFPKTYDKMKSFESKESHYFDDVLSPGILPKRRYYFQPYNIALTPIIKY